MDNNAIVFCEGMFGELDGKTANGLVRYSSIYKIVGVIDSTKAGKDAGEYLDGKKNEILIYRSIDEALSKIKEPVNYFIYGIAPSSARLPKEHRTIIFDALRHHLNIVSGLMDFFTEDRVMMKEARAYSVRIFDIRKPPSKRKLHIFTGKILDVKVPVVAVLGMDTAIGKRTTTICLKEALKARGINAVFITTGQTGLLQGAKYGRALDAIPGEFIIGEVEYAVTQAYENEHPDIILVEGQSSLSHPAFLSSFAILKGARPDAIILQYAPKRKVYCDYPFLPISDLQKEINLIKKISKADVIAITLNHEKMTDEELDRTAENYEAKYQLPTADVLKHGTDKIIKAIVDTFPSLAAKLQI
jgi:uncharacterized NAD-dependent epimerase/dehydratase family protein